MSIKSNVDRDLDANIMASIFGWKLTDVSPDAKGENACQILTRDGLFPDDFDLPKMGKIHRGYFAPLYSSRWDEAISLAKHVGLDLRISELPGTPRGLSRMCLDHWMTNHKSKA